MAPVRGDERSSKAAPTTPYGYGTHHADFIQRFTEQEARDRIGKKNRPQPLTAEQRAALPQYDRYLAEMKRYCDFSKLVALVDTIKKANMSTATDFIYWICGNYRITSEGSSWEYFRQHQQLYTDINSQYIDRNDCRTIKNFHDTVTAVRFGLRKPNIGGKPVASVDSLLSLLIFNIAFHTTVFPFEGHRIPLACYYAFLAYTGARPAEIVNNEPSKPKDGAWEELYDRKAIRNETLGRGRPKALCYEDILLMVVHHPETGKDILAMAVKFIHHKGADSKPKL
ncbi:hypothetical protein MFIFM68171_10168 [Madurella fahalii]|uniref:Uncharacterized protein n=1 Tax=Madurella fahalii TaxID=1157608 RepID=A0ABQ0GQD9_9PEZI